MLLNDLLKLFSTNFNINEERFVDIIESNNIKLSQRLLCNIKTSTNEKNTVIVTSENTNPVNEIVLENNLNKKKESGGRGRGRPKKTKEVKEDNNVLVEVEMLMLDGKEYYKTKENVLLNMEMEILGIYVDGRILNHSIK
jgi:ABC-type antimicrobial peptide transport system permease subunit